MIFQIQVSTSQRDEMIDISKQVQNCVVESGLNEGICMAYVPHTTAAVTINENADSDVKRDIIYELDKIIPHWDGYYHMEGNSAAHLKASMFGFSEHIMIENGRLLLGTWQGIYFCEFDGARDRTVYVKILG